MSQTFQIRFFTTIACILLLDALLRTAFPSRFSNKGFESSCVPPHTTYKTSIESLQWRPKLLFHAELVSLFSTIIGFLFALRQGLLFFHAELVSLFSTIMCFLFTLWQGLLPFHAELVSRFSTIMNFLFVLWQGLLGIWEAQVWISRGPRLLWREMVWRRYSGWVRPPIGDGREIFGATL